MTKLIVKAENPLEKVNRITSDWWGENIFTSYKFKFKSFSIESFIVTWIEYNVFTLDLHQGMWDWNLTRYFYSHIWDTLLLIINSNAMLIVFPFQSRFPTLACHKEVTILLHWSKCSAAAEHRATTEQVWAGWLALPSCRTLKVGMLVGYSLTEILKGNF